MRQKLSVVGDLPNRVISFVRLRRYSEICISGSPCCTNEKLLLDSLRQICYCAQLKVGLQLVALFSPIPRGKEAHRRYQWQWAHVLACTNSCSSLVRGEWDCKTCQLWYCFLQRQYQRNTHCLVRSLLSQNLLLQNCPYYLLLSKDKKLVSKCGIVFYPLVCFNFSVSFAVSIYALKESLEGIFCKISS